MEYRIEQLAQAAGVAVDTIRFYQGKGLLSAPRREGRVTWYADEHLERLRRIRSLQQRGFTLTVIRRFLEGELEVQVGDGPRKVYRKGEMFYEPPRALHRVSRNPSKIRAARFLTIMLTAADEKEYVLPERP